MNDATSPDITVALEWMAEHPLSSRLFFNENGKRDVQGINAGKSAAWRAACVPEKNGKPPSLVINIDSEDGPGATLCSLIHEARHAAQIEAGAKDPHGHPPGSLLLLAILEADAVAVEAVVAVRLGRAGRREPIEEASQEPDHAHLEAAWLATKPDALDVTDERLYEIAMETAFSDPVRNLLLAFGHSDREYARAGFDEARNACDVIETLPLSRPLPQNALAASPFRLDENARVVALAAGLARTAAKKTTGTERIAFLAKARALADSPPSPKKYAMAADVALAASAALDEDAVVPAISWLAKECLAAAASLSKSGIER